jgi:hypothetical protein
MKAIGTASTKQHRSYHRVMQWCVVCALPVADERVSMPGQAAYVSSTVRRQPTQRTTSLFVRFASCNTKQIP